MRIVIVALTLSLLSCGVTYGQKGFFNTVTNESLSEKEAVRSSVDPVTTETQPLLIEPQKARDSLSSIQLFLENLSVKELEYLISEYTGKSSSSEQIKENKNINHGAILKFYKGESHNLTIPNVLTVMEEVGISNQIIVLAQSLLETGFYTSNVCKKYNNLFGLYDSRRHDYYRFERWEDSVIGYQKFIQYRYKGGNYLSFLKRIGYAEDPRYTSKVCKLVKKICDMGTIAN